MPGGPAAVSIPAMLRAISLSPSRFLLLPEERQPVAPRTVKRYRLARMKIAGRDSADRFAHLRRAYD
jgi:hypothetical protein